MTTAAPEPPAISEEVFDGPSPQETVYTALRNKIQGIEIKGRNVTLYGWADTWPNGSPSLTVEGPTGGKRKVDPKRRIGSFRVEPR
ncbi:hypothetical protein BBAD15_g4948 [Beauveria bassiana D1-5]|uniref:Uncharacterized protein n=1 Tax=Beauveria bassiana D1-5 TaxID=1245745 RepID=A0A0A2VQ59_BEABA|nr:hypothetical protein BBAD15_g4948 [Beauveria bassiana D1-5]